MDMKRVIILAGLVFLLLAAKIHGAEIDSFTPRDKIFPSGFPAINLEVNKRIQKALRNANQISSCNALILEGVLGAELLSPFYGRIEDYANTSANVAKFHVFFKDSVYRNLPPFNTMLMSIGESLFNFGNVIHQGRLLIGTDKFGHFFDEGHRFYGDLKPDGSNLDEVLTTSESTEDGVYGRAVGGIKSYADLVANYHGMHFWSEILQSKFKQDRRYLKCLNNQWVQVRQFDFGDYINAAWDEGINCSEYQSAEYENAVFYTILELPVETKRPALCPIYPEECSKLVLYYGKIASKLLGPKCLMIRPSSFSQK